MSLSVAELEPLLICLGVRKSATTWLHRQLETHPEISCTKGKQIGFWMGKWDKGFDWYSDQFHLKPTSKIRAEVTPNYLNKRAISRFARELKNSKFVIILRDPYERAFSEYLHARRNGEAAMSFLEEATPDSNFITNSLYAPGLSFFLDHFDREKLHVGLHDEIKADPEAYLSSLFSFAGVDPKFVPETVEEKYNVSRSATITDRFLKGVEVGVKRIGFGRKHLSLMGLSSTADDVFRRLAQQNPAPTITAEEEVSLQAIFEPDIERTETVLEIDLSHWKRS